MASEINSAADFYETARGAVAQAVLRERLSLLWPNLNGQVVLGLGYTAPFLDCWPNVCAISALPAPAPAVRPSGATCAVVEDALPFADLSVDRILLVHGLENAENVRRMLREVWRVLKEDGRLLAVVPNRVGLWAHVESTPFGQGQPYSQGQIDRLLAASLFRVERRDRALYMPPSSHRLILRGAGLFERAGRSFAPHLAGLMITEAAKEVWAAIPLAKVARRRLVLAKAA